MNKKWRVLIFPAGTEIAMEIFQALRYAKEAELYAGTSVPCHAEMLYGEEKYIDDMPFISSADFIERLNDIVSANEIDFIYPAYDAVQLYLMEHEKEIKAKIVSAPPETVAICRSKAKTYEFFAGENFVPRVFRKLDDVESFPVFAKPKVGQGSEGVRLIEGIDPEAQAIADDDSYLLCEYLPGEEYTVDCFTDEKGKLRVASMRSRERIRNGISARSHILPQNDEAQSIAEKINSRLSFCGAWFFQLKRDSHGKYKLLEISARVPGTMGATRHVGINFPLLTLYVLSNMPVELIRNNYGVLDERALASRYKFEPLSYTDVYVDYDDTLIIGGKVNTLLMRFLYQAINDGKRLHLLSRHTGDIHSDMKSHRLSEGMFESIEVMARHEKKSDYIKSGSAIFIDDSFAERKEVLLEKGIPVFDLDMIDGLIDDRSV